MNDNTEATTPEAVQETPQPVMASADTTEAQPMMVVEAAPVAEEAVIAAPVADAVAENDAADEAEASFVAAIEAEIASAPEEDRPTFDSIGLSEEIVKAVTESGYRHPTPIQEQAIPHVLMGRDMLGCAQTGTGKTASFVLPMLDILTGSRAKARMPRSLILEPTRELALQVAENFEKYGKYLKLNHALLIGGESMNDQRDVLDKGVDVLIATPGRLLDLFDRGRVLLADCKVLVIDEADRMLDMGFIPDVERIVSMLPPIRQTLFFSATMAPEIRRLADAFLSNPKEITVAPPASVATTITTGLAYVQPFDKREALRRLIRREQVTNALIFCNRKIEVDILYKSLKKHGFSVGALHGDMDQSQRFATLNAFKANELQLLVCSDVAARGIDIGGLSHVFNFDVPFHSEDYVHRIGRTGRAGREGHAYSIATADDARNVAAIEKLTGKAIPRLEIEGLEPVTEAEIQEALTAPKRGRGRGGPARRPDRRDGGRGRPERGRRDASDRAPRPEAPEDLAAEAPARRERPERRPRAEAPEAREAPRRDHAPRRDRDAQPSEFALREAAMRDFPPRDRDAPRQDRDYRGRDRRDDLGPPVQGFGDLVPAFMLIPVPRRKRDVAAEAPADEPPEASAA